MAVVRGRRFLPIGPILLIGLGILLLLNNFGLIPWEVWRTIARLWPLVLVLLGIQALVTGRVDWGSLILLLAAFAVLSLVLWLQTPALSLAGPRGAASSTSSSFQQSLNGANSAAVTVDFGVGRLEIGSLDEPGLLARGSLSGQAAGQIRSSYQVRDGQGNLVVRAGGRPGGFPFGGQSDGPSHQLTLELTKAVPLDLEVESGASEVRLDLHDLQLRTLRLSTGASRAEITLPSSGQTRAEIEAGAASLRINVPAEVAARIETRGSALSPIQIDESRFPRRGDVYESPDYANATNRVEIILEVGAARVEID